MSPSKPIPPRDLYLTVAVAVLLALLTAVLVRIASNEAERERATNFGMAVERIGNAVRSALSDHFELVERWRNVLAVSPSLTRAQMDSLFQGSRQRQLYGGIGSVIVAVPGKAPVSGDHRPDAGSRPYSVAYSMGEAGPALLREVELQRSDVFRRIESRPGAQQKPVLVRMKAFDGLVDPLPALVVPVLAGNGQVGCWIVVWIDFAKILQRVGTLQVPPGFAVFLRHPASGESLGSWGGLEGRRVDVRRGPSGVPDSRYARTLTEFAEEPLELSVAAAEDSLFAAEAEWPVVIAVGGAAMVLLATLGTHVLLRRRREAGEMQRRLAGALQAGEQRFRDLVETTPDWVWETDADGVYTYSSPSCAALFGYAPEDIVGTRGEVIWGPGNLSVGATSGVNSGSSTGAASGASPGAADTGGIRLRTARHRSGRRITLESSSVPVRGPDGQPSGQRGFDRDVSRRVALEEELRLLQSRLIGATQAESVGQAMVGLAHELNQPLAAVVTYNQACLRMVEADGNINPDIREAMRATASHALLASDIVRKFRDLVGGRRIQRDWIRAEDVIKHAIDIASTRKSREKIRINVDIERDLPEVSGDATLLVQVVLNLLNNAMDAVARSRIREITVRAYRDTGNESAGKVRLEVADTGGGISEVARSQMFEPYFTTKLDGVGMGLAVCRSIIEAHGEEIHAGTSSDGRTVFWFTLGAREGAHA